MLTEKSLGIFWNGEEVGGLNFYVFWPSLSVVEPAFPEGLWPFGTEVRLARLGGVGWAVLLWDVRISQSSAKEQWCALLESTLAELCRTGAVVAWCGLEGRFADPPSLFDPKETSDAVYAYLSPRLGFVCAARLGEEFETITDRQLLGLRQLVSAPV